VDEDGHVADPGVEPVGDQQVVGHVVVDEPDPEDADPLVGDERDRGDDEGQRSGHRRPDCHAPRRPFHRPAPHDQQDRGGGEHHADRDRHRRPVARELDRQTTRHQQRGEADGAGEPRPVPPAAEEQDRLADDERARAYERDGCVGAQQGPRS
jgi:hypothetical protein